MTNADTPKRTRTFSWQDPQIGLDAARTMGGLEYLQAMARGDLPGPPIAALMNIEGFTAEKGRVMFTVIPAEYHYNPIGMVHGGLACTLCDSAMGCAVQSMLPAGTAYTTLELKVNFVRAMTTGTGRVRCEGTVIHIGSRVATAEARVLDASDKLYAHATTTCLVFPAGGGR